MRRIIEESPDSITLGDAKLDFSSTDVKLIFTINPETGDVIYAFREHQSVYINGKMIEQKLFDYLEKFTNLRKEFVKVRKSLLQNENKNNNEINTVKFYELKLSHNIGEVNLLLNLIKSRAFFHFQLANYYNNFNEKRIKKIITLYEKILLQLQYLVEKNENNQQWSDTLTSLLEEFSNYDFSLEDKKREDSWIDRSAKGRICGGRVWVNNIINSEYDGVQIKPGMDIVSFWVSAPQLKKYWHNFIKYIGPLLSKNFIMELNPENGSYYKKGQLISSKDFNETKKSLIGTESGESNSKSLRRLAYKNMGLDIDDPTLTEKRKLKVNKKSKALKEFPLGYDLKAWPGEKLNKKSTFLAVENENLKGGRADGEKKSQFNDIELAVGIAVEKEHVSDEKTAKEIAMDHLKENPTYYSDMYFLGFIEEGDALEIARQNSWGQQGNLDTNIRILKKDINETTLQGIANHTISQNDIDHSFSNSSKYRRNRPKRINKNKKNKNDQENFAIRTKQVIKYKNEKINNIQEQIEQQLQKYGVN